MRCVWGLRRKNEGRDILPCGAWEALSQTQGVCDLAFVGRELRRKNEGRDILSCEAWEALSQTQGVCDLTL